MREKVGKSRNTVFFQWFVAPEGRKVGSLKRRVRSQLARGEMKNCTPLWREAHFQVKMYKTHHCRTTFGSCNVEKVHAVVARSTFPSQNVQNTRGSDHFWKLRCRKSAEPMKATKQGTKKSMNEWSRESTNQWITEPMKQRSHESMTQRINESLNQAIKELMNQCVNQSMNQWIHESVNQWINRTSESRNQRTKQSLKQWTHESMNHLKQWMNAPTNQRINESVHQGISGSTNQGDTESLNQ